MSVYLQLRDMMNFLHKQPEIGFHQLQQIVHVHYAMLYVLKHQLTDDNIIWLEMYFFLSFLFCKINHCFYYQFLCFIYGEPLRSGEPFAPPYGNALYAFPYPLEWALLIPAGIPLPLLLLYYCANIRLLFINHSVSFAQYSFSRRILRKYWMYIL